MAGHPTYQVNVIKLLAQGGLGGRVSLLFFFVGGFHGFMEFFCFTVNRNCNGVECDTHARCVQSLDNSLQCECDSGWQGDGQNCSGKM